jgi:hypothetical protein
MSSPRQLLIQRLWVTSYPQGLYPKCPLTVTYHIVTYSDTVASTMILAWDYLLQSMVKSVMGFLVNTDLSSGEIFFGLVQV